LFNNQGQNNKNTGGGLFSLGQNTNGQNNKNNGGGSFSLGGNNNQKSTGLGLGNNNNNNKSGTSLLGNNNNNKSGTGLFGNKTNTSNGQSSLFGNKTNTGGGQSSLFGNKTNTGGQSSLFSNTNNNNGQQNSTGLFNNTTQKGLSFNGNQSNNNFQSQSNLTTSVQDDPYQLGWKVHATKQLPGKVRSPNRIRLRTRAKPRSMIRLSTRSRNHRARKKKQLHGWGNKSTALVPVKTSGSKTKYRPTSGRHKSLLDSALSPSARSRSLVPVIKTADFKLPPLPADVEQLLLGMNETPSNNPPTLLNHNFTCKPSIQLLKSMSDNQLRQMKQFSISQKNIGSVEFLEPVDIRGVKLDEIIKMKPGTIELYPADDVPEVNSGLNVKAKITLLNIFPKKGRNDPAKLKHFEATLKKICTDNGRTFVKYVDGTWELVVPNFSS